MIRPSLIAWLAASGDLSLMIRWTVHCPAALLVVGLIHHVDASDLGGSPVSLSISLFSPNASGL